MSKNYDIRPTYIVELDSRLSDQSIQAAVESVSTTHNLLLRKAMGITKRGKRVPTVEFYDYDQDFFRRKEGERSESQQMTKEHLYTLLEEVLRHELDQLVEEERSGFWSILRAV